MNYLSLKVTQLKQECKKHSLSTSGRKDDLIKGLVEHDQETKVSPEVSPPEQEISKTKSETKVKVDQGFLATGEVLETENGKYSCLLHEINPSEHHNKFYIIQVIEAGSNKFYSYNRWGRIGHDGQQTFSEYYNQEDAINDFEKNFMKKLVTHGQIAQILL